MQLPSIELTLIAGRAIFLVFSFVIAAIAFTRWRRFAERDSKQLATQSAILLERLMGLEHRVAATHSRIDQLADRVDTRLQLADSAPQAPPSYSLAIRMARSGVSCDEIVSCCGITRQEAELVLRLHAQR